METYSTIIKKHNDKIVNLTHSETEKTANKLINMFRATIKKYKTNNHTICLSSGMGSVSIDIVNNRTGRKYTSIAFYYYEWRNESKGEIWLDLNLIASVLDWNLFYNFDNVKLN